MGVWSTLLLACIVLYNTDTVSPFVACQGKLQRIHNYKQSAWVGAYAAPGPIICSSCHKSKGVQHLILRHGYRVR
jgi:hypothetical protein